MTALSEIDKQIRALYQRRATLLRARRHVNNGPFDDSRLRAIEQEIDDLELKESKMRTEEPAR